MKKHLHRLPRVWIRDTQFFITTCTMGRKPILNSEAAHVLLRAEWQGSQDRYGWAIGRYVIMPDHVHFFCVDTDGRSTLSAFVGAWKQWTSKAISKHMGIHSPVWQPEFFDHLLRSEESFSEKWEYVRNNPVRQGFVEEADAWPYQGKVHYDFGWE